MNSWNVLFIGNFQTVFSECIPLKAYYLLNFKHQQSWWGEETLSHTNNHNIHNHHHYHHHDLLLMMTCWHHSTRWPRSSSTLSMSTWWPWSSVGSSSTRGLIGSVVTLIQVPLKYVTIKIWLDFMVILGTVKVPNLEHWIKLKHPKNSSKMAIFYSW